MTETRKLENVLIPALPAEVGVPVPLPPPEFPSNAVAPPNKINLGPIYVALPSSPTAGTAVSVWPHRGPGPSSFFSQIAFTTEYVGACLGPATGGASGDTDPDKLAPESSSELGFESAGWIGEEWSESTSIGGVREMREMNWGLIALIWNPGVEIELNLSDDFCVYV